MGDDFIFDEEIGKWVLDKSKPLERVTSLSGGENVVLEVGGVTKSVSMGALKEHLDTTPYPTNAVYIEDPSW